MGSVFRFLFWVGELLLWGGWVNATPGWVGFCDVRLLLVYIGINMDRGVKNKTKQKKEEVGLMTCLSIKIGLLGPNDSSRTGRRVCFKTGCDTMLNSAKKKTKETQIN